MSDIRLTSRYSTALRRLESLTGKQYTLQVAESYRGRATVELLAAGASVSMGSGVCVVEAAEVAISRAAMAAISASGKRAS